MLLTITFEGDIIPIGSALIAFVLSLLGAWYASKGHHADDICTEKPDEAQCSYTIEEIVQMASFVVNGYAFISKDDKIRVVNLNNRSKATVFAKNGNILMTSMDDIEIDIISTYLAKNREFLEVE